MSKLTLSVDRTVASRTKQFAKRQGVSVSAMVEAYLAAVSGPPQSYPDTPILRTVRGSIKRAGLKAYGRYLSDKYR